MAESTRVRPDTSDMAAVHKVFRTSLASGPTFVGSAAGDDERRALISNYYVNLMALLEAHHDSEEKLVFPLLVDRCSDHRQVVERAADQHEAVVGLLHAVNENLETWQLKGDPEAAELVRSLQALDAVLSPHLDQEEAEVVPMAADYLTVEEWGALPGHAMAAFTGDKIWLIIGLIRENFTPAQCDAMLEHMPPPARQMWETKGEAAFDDTVARVRQAS